ncbi:hypothetical protein PG991_007609 [Apiospora marii]|uniref:Uncharacterized protein n=1 Tax=Apiospora marii TaxID=335849 RepID=A0ABR1RTY8_9PEZI
MDKSFASLSGILKDNFHVTSASSMRQDQWYKRVMESWKATGSGGDVLILSPKDARTEWTPKVYSFAKEFADVVQKASQKEREDVVNEISELSKASDKVFDDSTIVKGPPSCFFDGDDGLLGYVEQNVLFWVTRSGEATQGPRPQRARSVKKLLERHDSMGLLALATAHGPILRSLAELTPPKRSEKRCDAQQGWLTALDETLEVMVFIMALLCFDGQLLSDHGYARWLPAMRDYPGHPAVWIYLGNQGFGGIASKNPKAAGLTEKRLRDHLDWHFRTLSIAVLLMDACGVAQNPPLEDRIVNAFLHLVGFEAWNREREDGTGHSYLECKLNQGKSAKWLRSQVPDEGRRMRLPTMG